MFHTTEDIHIQWTKVVLPPVFLEEEFPTSEGASETIFKTRKEITDILEGRIRGCLCLWGRARFMTQRRRANMAGC